MLRDPMLLQLLNLALFESRSSVRTAVLAGYGEARSIQRPFLQQVTSADGIVGLTRDTAMLPEGCSS